MKRILEVKKKIGVLSKNSKNPFFKSAYLDLNGLLKAVEPLLQDEGLILLQPIIGNKVTTLIVTEENQTLIESSIELPLLTDPQKLGSCITYFRRYTLKSLLAIAEGDDDANLASKPDPVRKVVKEEFTADHLGWEKAIEGGFTPEKIRTKYNLSPKNEELFLQDCATFDINNTKFFDK